MNITAALLFWFALPNGAAVESGQSACPPPDTLVFSLTISEHRDEHKDAAFMDETPDVTFRSEYTLYGRIRPRVQGRHDAVVFADSILYDRRSPLALSTFMSADTMYYRASGGTTAIDRRGIPAYDSMLTCLFEGAALIARYTDGGGVADLIHLKEQCQSGQYGHINLPVTMGIFMPDSATLRGEINQRWRKIVDLPSFSGVGFYPRMALTYRIVDDDGRSRVLSVYGDSTITDCRTRKKTGEALVIVSDRIRVGGTIKTDPALGLCRSGEIRIRETMQVLLPDSNQPALGKKCEYAIRLQIR